MSLQSSKGFAEPAELHRKKEGVPVISRAVPPAAKLIWTAHCAAVPLCRHTVPVITFSRAATCRSSAGRNGREPHCSTTVFSGKVEVPTGVPAARHLLHGRQVALPSGTSDRQQCISTPGSCPAWDNFGGLTARLSGKSFGSVCISRHGNRAA
jgi:hypothetical protein